MKLALLIALSIPASAQMLQGIVGASAVAAGPTSGFTASSTIISAVGNNFPLTAVTVSSGQAVVVAWAVRGTTTNLCATITGATGTGGDTLTVSGTVSGSAPFLSCVGVASIWNPTPNASYVVTLTGGVTSPASLNTAALTFSKGSVVGTADGTCSNSSAGSQTPTCSAAITPTGTFELGIGACGSYDNLGGTEADNSTPAFTLPAAGKVGSTIVGGLLLEYYAPAGAPAGSITPGCKNLGAGDPVSIWGAAFK